MKFRVLYFDKEVGIVNAKDIDKATEKVEELIEVSNGKRMTVRFDSKKVDLYPEWTIEEMVKDRCIDNFRVVKA